MARGWETIFAHRPWSSAGWERIRREGSGCDINGGRELRKDPKAIYGQGKKKGPSINRVQNSAGKKWQANHQKEKS